MKKVVKLNEEDIERMVGKIIKEEGIGNSEDILGWLKPGAKYAIGWDYSDRLGSKEPTNVYTYEGIHETAGKTIAKFSQIVRGKVVYSYQFPKILVDYRKRNQLNLVEKAIKESNTLPRRERERHSNQFAKSKFEPYDREREIMDAFGPYRDDVPANVVSYLRKNPKRFLQKLTAVYGMDRMLEYIGHEQNLDLDPNIG